MANDYAGSGQHDPTVKAIEGAVAFFFGMRVDELHHKSATRAVAVPRQIAMYLMKQMTAASAREIGQHFGNRHPSNVGRTISRLEEQRCKRGVVDLVICELLTHTELRLTRERNRLGVAAGQCDGADECLMRKIQDRIAKNTSTRTKALKNIRQTHVVQGGPPQPFLYQG